MSKNFNAIKRKYFIAAIIAGVALGICCGAAATCGLAVILKRCAVEFFWALYIPIGLVLSAGFGGLFFLILRPSDIKVAKKLDRGYSLKQKVQTMVEFSAEDGAMAQLQREQADEALGAAAKKRIDLKWLWKFAFIPVLAVAMLFVGIFVPAKKSADTDPIIDITVAQRAALANLIAEVRESSLEDGLKTSTVEVLDGLMSGLDKSQPQSVVRAAVISSVKLIDGLVASTNTYLKVNNVFKADEQLKTLSSAMVSGVVFYKSTGIRLSSFEAVKTHEKKADESISAELEKWRENFLLDYSVKIDGNDNRAPIAVAEAAKKLKAYSANLDRNLKLDDLAQYIPAEQNTRAAKDGLYTSLSTFAKTLAELASSTSGINNNQSYYESIRRACTEFSGQATAALCAQSYNCTMDEYIRNALAKIFNISVSQFGSNEDVAPSNPGDNTPGEEEPPSPIGPGDITYGSDDKVLNVDTGLSEEYGNLLDKYNVKVTEYIMAGACSEEVALYIRQYFQMLYNGIKEDKE